MPILSAVLRPGLALMQRLRLRARLVLVFVVLVVPLLAMGMVLALTRRRPRSDVIARTWSFRDRAAPLGAEPA